MSIFPQLEGVICLSDQYKFVLDGIEICSSSRLDLQIGGHWIDGIIVEYKGNQYWSSWKECVTVNISLGMKARRPAKT